MAGLNLVKPEYNDNGCLTCGDAHLKSVYERPGYTLSTPTHKLTFDLSYKVCTCCGLVLMSPQLSQSCWDQYILNACFTTLEPVDLQKEKAKLTDLERSFLDAHLGPQSRVLEIGCGDGHQLYWMSRTYGCSTFGIDLSRKYCEYVREELGLEVANISLEHLDVAEKTYDLIFSKHVFEHLCDPLEGLHKARTLLADGGAFILMVPSVEAVTYSLRDMFAAHNYLFCPVTLRNLLTRAGFAVESCIEGTELLYILRKAQPDEQFFVGDYERVRRSLDRSVSRYEKIFSGAIERVKGFIERWRSSGAALVIFGSGEHTFSLLETFDFSGCDIRFLIDSNRSLRGSMRYGYRVLHPEDLAGESFDEILISSFTYQEEIARQLQGLGVQARICKIYDADVVNQEV